CCIHNQEPDERAGGITRHFVESTKRRYANQDRLRRADRYVPECQRLRMPQNAVRRNDQKGSMGINGSLRLPYKHSICS
ncbi:hypothetical protein KXV65_006803, partial [Aspergillus fumigatus]